MFLLPVCLTYDHLFMKINNSSVCCMKCRVSFRNNVDSLSDKKLVNDKGFCLVSVCLDLCVWTWISWLATSRSSQHYKSKSRTGAHEQQSDPRLQWLSHLEWWNSLNWSLLDLLSCTCWYWSCLSSPISPSESPSDELSQVEFGDGVPCSLSSSSSSSSLTAWLCGAPLRSCSVRRWSRKLMYLRARRRISFLLSFLSGGWVGMRRRSSANAPFTFCWRHRSRLLVKIRRTTLGRVPEGRAKKGQLVIREPDLRM